VKHLYGYNALSNKLKIIDEMKNYLAMQGLWRN